MNANDSTGPDPERPESALTKSAPPAAGQETQPRAATGGGPVRPAAKGARGGGRAWALTALVVALIALGGAVYSWQRAERMVRQAALNWHEIGERVGQLEQQGRLGQDQVRDLIGRVAVQESKLGETTEQQSQLERLYRNFAADALDSVLADVEVAVSIASQQLQVAGNVQAALSALQDAENGLRRADSQAVAGLQRLVARDIERLRGVPQVDLGAMSSRLDGLIGSLGEFPMLVGPQSPERAPEPPVEVVAEAEPTGTLERIKRSGLGAWAYVKDELGSLIRVNRVDDPNAVMLAPDQQFFIKENLRLSLLSARLALLARDDRVLQNDVAHAIDWLNRYYDAQQRSVANAIDSLKQMQSSRIAAGLPSLSETLSAVRAQRAAREGAR